MLVLVVLVPLFLGILQVALVLHVRNTLAAAASEGARYAATVDRPVEAGAARTREQIAGALSGRFARDVSARPATVDGAPGRRGRRSPPRCRRSGSGDPASRLDVTGHAVEETPP